MTEEPDPAPFPDSDVAESETRRVLLNCLDSPRVKVTFNTRDTYPNRDGFVEITDDDGVPVGDIVIQVKKLHDSATDPPRHRATVASLIYARQISPPLFFLCVDVSAGVVYWKHISDAWLLDHNQAIADQQTKTIELERTHAIEPGSTDYVDAWEQIAVESTERTRTARPQEDPAISDVTDHATGSWEQVARERYDPSASHDLTVSVVEMVASVREVPPLELEPLYETVDPEALDRLFAGWGDDEATPPMNLNFYYGNHLVKVNSDGTIQLFEPAAIDEDSP